MNWTDNIFVLRQNFRQHLLQTSVLKKQLQPFMDEIGMDISADVRVENLSAFERVVVELLKAVVMGYHLIVLDEISIFVSGKEMRKLSEVLRHYTGRGFSFLYISSHFEEIVPLCDRAGFLCNGRLQKIVQEADMNRKYLQECLEGYDRSVWGYPENGHLPRAGREIRMEAVFADRREIRFAFSVNEGECLTLRAQDDQILQSCVLFLTGEERECRNE